MGKRPFVAILVAPDNETVLLTHQSIDHVNHAESSLARLASSHYTQPYLWQCTLYSTWEPCAMCISTCYWVNIGRIVYAASETVLAKLTGQGNEENMTMAMPCRDVLKGSQKDVEIIGPLDDWENVVREQSDGYWKPIRERRSD
jgi:tRNA(Arg) A34 adenosine deaminase TadA